MSAAFTIADSGDIEERKYWARFARDHFPSYESFWAKRVAPLTYRAKRDGDIRFQTNEELAGLGFSDEDVAVAQLHYTVLLHLGRVYDVLAAARGFARPWLAATDGEFGRHVFFESFARLSGTSDVADELLQRRATPGTYGAWDERAGARARSDWRNANGDPLRPIRAYRNRLVHGRIVPELHADLQSQEGEFLGKVLMCPRLETVDDYLDWRLAFDQARRENDFSPATVIVRDAWEKVVAYVEQAWRTQL